MAALEEVMTLVAVVVSSVRQHVCDGTLRTFISNDLRRLLRTGESARRATGSHLPQRITDAEEIVGEKPVVFSNQVST
jgi:hypothetical protein